MTKRVELKDGFILIKGATEEQLKKIINIAREKIEEYENLIKEIELMLNNPEDKKFREAFEKDKSIVDLGELA